MDKNAQPKLHLALNTARLDESVRFYQAFFGTKPVKNKPGYAKFSVDSPALNLTLNQAESVSLGALNHLGIQVESSEAVLAARQRLEERGLTIDRIEMGTECCYARQDKFWIVDPNGFSWEFFYVEIEDTRPDLERPAGVATDRPAAACCAPPSKTASPSTVEAPSGTPCC